MDCRSTSTAASIEPPPRRHCKACVMMRTSCSFCCADHHTQKKSSLHRRCGTTSTTSCYVIESFCADVPAAACSFHCSSSSSFDFIRPDQALSLPAPPAPLCGRQWRNTMNSHYGSTYPNLKDHTPPSRNMRVPVFCWGQALPLPDP